MHKRSQVRVTAAASAVALAAAVIAFPTVASAAAPAGAATVTAQQARGKAVTLRINDKDGRVRSGAKVTFTGRVRPPGARPVVRLQKKRIGTSSARWRTIGKTRHDGRYRLRLRVPEGAARYRTVVATKRGTVASRPVRIKATDPDFTGITMPQDQQKVLDAITGAKNSVEIVIYDFGAQDIVTALQKAKTNLAKNNPDKPVIRVMVNNQWYGTKGAASHYSYVAKAASDLGVGANGKSADGVVQFNYTANNFSLTHQKSILIDTLRPDGTEYANAGQLPASASAIVATFNLQAYGWATQDSGCSNNPACGFAGGNPGTRDFGIIANDPAHVWEVQQVYSSDFNGPTPTETNTDLGLNDPTSNLVWSNGATGILVPPPTGTGLLYSPTAASYPAAAGAELGSGFYPAPYYRFAQDQKAGQTATPQVDIELGTPQGNANAVHLRTIQAATDAATAGKPATLYIYNEEYNDDAVLDAIQDAAAAGVSVRIVMTYGASNGYAYDDLVTTTLTNGGGPVDAQVHLYPNASPQYMYIHAKMIYADLPDGQDVAFVGSQNFSENSLLFNREAGVQLKQSDGTMTAALKTMLTGTFSDDFSVTGAKTTWTLNGATLPCAVVEVTPQQTWASQKATIYPGPSYSNPTNAGCQTAAPVTSPPADYKRLQSVAKTVESWRATGLPDFGASATGNFAAPLANVSAEYNPPMPQGPITPTNMVPGACVLIDQTTGAPAGACPASN